MEQFVSMNNDNSQQEELTNYQADDSNNDSNSSNDGEDGQHKDGSPVADSTHGHEANTNRGKNNVKMQQQHLTMNSNVQQHHHQRAVNAFNTTPQHLHHHHHHHNHQRQQQKKKGRQQQKHGGGAFGSSSEYQSGGAAPQHHFSKPGIHQAHHPAPARSATNSASFSSSSSSFLQHQPNNSRNHQQQQQLAMLQALMSQTSGIGSPNPSQAAAAPTAGSNNWNSNAEVPPRWPSQQQQQQPQEQQQSQFQQLASSLSALMNSQSQQQQQQQPQVAAPVSQQQISQDYAALMASLAGRTNSAELNQQGAALLMGSMQSNNSPHSSGPQQQAQLPPTPGPTDASQPMDAALQLLMNPQVLSSLLIILGAALQQPQQQQVFQQPAPAPQPQENSELSILSTLLAASLGGQTASPKPAVAALPSPQQQKNYGSSTGSDNTSALLKDVIAALTTGGGAQSTDSSNQQNVEGAGNSVLGQFGYLLNGQVPPQPPIHVRRAQVASLKSTRNNNYNNIVSDRSSSASSPPESDNDNAESSMPVYNFSTFRPKGEVKLPMVVYMECDEESLSEYQCLLRKQIEIFEASSDDVQWNAQGRNKPIVTSQVGLRCRYCASLPTWSRARGAVYYSATLDGLYQAAQNMAKNHLCRHCRLIPGDVRAKLVGLRDSKRRAAGGKKYWAEGVRCLGVIETPHGLQLRRRPAAEKVAATKKIQG